MPKKNLEYKIGVDIGGTNMKAVLFDGSKAVADFVLATPKDTYEHLLIMLYALLEPLLERARKDQAKISGLGVGVAGTINFDKRIVTNSPNLTIINNMPIISDLEKKLELPVFIDNDANCFTRAEVLAGSAMKHKNVFGVIVGTGIGGAWWINGEAYRGVHGGAGEPGHMLINFENKIDLENAFHKLFQNNPMQVAEEAYRGDVLAEKTYREFGDYLGMAFANIVNLIDPEAIVIGGSVSYSSDLFLKQAKKAMKEFIAAPEAKEIIILKSKLKDNAGAIGAALLVA